MTNLQRRLAIQRIESLVENILLSLSTKSRHIKSDFVFDCLSYTTLSAKEIKDSALSLQILAKIYKLLLCDSLATMREIYYEDPDFYGNQNVVNRNIRQISTSLQIPRWNLNIIPTSKGLVAGFVTFRTSDGEIVDCSGTVDGVLIPSRVLDIEFIDVEAVLILIVEKDATFQTLLDQDIFSRIPPAVMLTGKGMPDMNTRLFAHRLWKEFQLPCFCLVDGDPHGIGILTVYKYGPKSMPTSPENPFLVLPNLEWIGVMPSEIDTLAVPQEAQIPIQEYDRKKAQQLIQRDVIQLSEPLWKAELEFILKSEYKVEIQCLNAVDCYENFLASVYLPHKLELLLTKNVV